MATKQEAIDHFISEYNAEPTEDENLFRTVFTYTDSGRSQLVLVKFLDDKAVISSRFATTEDITHKQALVAAQEYICGIAQIGEGFFCRNVISLTDLDVSDFNVALEMVTVVADTLEEQIVGNDEQ
jgi:hypothetical protein